MAYAGGKYSRSVEGASDAVYDFQCSPCEKEGKYVEALNACVECRQNLCSTCLGYHNRFEGMKGHTVLDKAGMTARGPQASQFVPTAKCNIHQAEVDNMYCSDHDVVCCGVCIAIKHRSCDVVDFLQHATRGSEKPQIKTIDNRPVRSATLRGQYGIKVQSDVKTCSINDICLIKDGYPVLSDWGNNKLKLLDQTYTVVDSCTLPGGPWGICSTGPSEIAVVLSTSKQKMIQFVSIGNKLTLTRAFNVGGYCRYVAFSKGELFVTYGDKEGNVKPEVKVYSLTGNHLRTIRNDKFGQQIFLNPFCIDINNEGTSIHVVEEKGVITVDRQGQEQSTFSDPSLKGAVGICVLENDNLLVSGYKSNNVIQIDSQGKMSGEIISQTDGLRRTRALCYDGINSRLIVIMYNVDYIKVFDLIRKQ